MVHPKVPNGRNSSLRILFGPKIQTRIGTNVFKVFDPGGVRQFKAIGKRHQDAYKSDFQGKYALGAFIYVINLSFCDVGNVLDSRTNPFQEGGDDMNHGTSQKAQGPITSSKIKRSIEHPFTSLH